MSRMHAVIGSANSVKVRAAQLAFDRLGMDVEVRGVSGVESGVRDQPLSIEETRRGARNRAEGARLRVPRADFWIGAEGGLFQDGDDWFECGWMHVLDRSGRVGLGGTPVFPVPTRLVEHLLKGADLNQAMEAVMGIEGIGSSTGFCGYITDGELARERAYTAGMTTALSRWVRPELWEL